MDDEELIRAAREGREYAAAFLVSLYAPMLLGHARAVAGDLGDAACEDICAWAVERAVRKIHLYNPARGDFTAWARSMLPFGARDYRRDNARLATLDDNVDVPDEPTEPLRELHEDVRTALREAVGKLSAVDQTMLALREIEQLPSKAVATLLSISDDAVRQRHSRARQRLGRIARDDPRLIAFLEGGPE